MLRLDQSQRRVLVDKLPDAANMAAGALFFGQFLAGQPFSLAPGLSGIGAWIALMGWTLAMAAEKDKR